MLVYAILGFLRPAIYIFLLPVYINFLEQGEYGHYNLMIDFAALSMILISLKLNTSMLTHYYDYDGDRDKIKHFLSNLYSASIFLALFIGLIFYLCGDLLFQTVFKDETLTFFPFGLLVVMYTGLMEANLVYYTYLKNEKAVINYASVLLVHILAAIIGQFIFIIILERGVQGALEGILIANVLVTLMILVKEPQIFRLRLDFKLIRKSLSFSIPLMPYLIIYWFLTKSGKTFLENYTDTDTVAVFGLLVVFMGLVLMGVESIINGVRPFLFDEFSKGKNADPNRIELLTRMIISTPLLVIPAVVLVGCNMQLITDKPNFHAISEFVTAAAAMYFLLVWSRLFYQQLVFTKKSHWVTLLSFVGVVVLIFLFYKWIPEYEIWGVIYSTQIANLIIAVLFYFAAQKSIYVSYNFGDIILTPIFIFSLLFAIEYGSIQWGYSKQTFSIIQFILLTGIIIFFNKSLIGDYRRVFLDAPK